MFTDWTPVTQLFDSYRIAAMKLKFIPDKPADTSTTTNYRPVYVFGDVDTASLPVTTPDAALQYENCAVKNLNMPWKYYFKVPKATQLATTVILQGGWIDVGTPRNQASINMVASGLDLSDNYGTVVHTVYLMARNRR